MLGTLVGDLILTGDYTSNSVLAMALVEALENDMKYKDAIKMYMDKYQSIEYPNFVWEGEPTDVNFVNFISPIGFMYDNEFDIVENIKEIARVNKDINMINVAIYMSLIILYVRKGISKDEIYRQLCIELKYIETPENIKDIFNNALYTLYHVEDYEQAIIRSKKDEVPVISPMAEAFYGIPEYLIENKKVPNEFIKKLRR